MTRKILLRIAVVLAVLFLIVGVGIYLDISEPIEDMRLRADALPIPSDFVLVSESYSAGALGFFGSVPHLQRTYHAPWPGVCDTLLSIRHRSGEPFEMAGLPPDVADKMCQLGAWYPAGWRGWCRNYRHYQLRLTAREPGFVWKLGPRTALLEVLYPKPNGYPDRTFTIPDGRASVDVELIASGGP